MRSIDRIKSPFIFSCGAILCITVLGAAPNAAFAQSADERAQVQKLFDEAGKAMDRRAYDEACPKFEKVVALEPAKVGARFALADCYEQSGRIASAAAAYKEAALRAATATDARVAKAVAKANELSGKAPRLTVRVSDAVRALPGLSIMRNGQPLEVGQWSQPIPADAGVCEISATATGKKPWLGKVTVVAAGMPAQIDVGPFVDAAPAVTAATPPDPTPVSTATPAPSAAPAPLAPTKDEAPAAKSGGAPKWAYAVGGLGVVSAGVAVGFIVAQSGAQKTFNTDCKGGGAHDPTTCASDKSALNRDFGLWLGFGVVGVAALAVSAITIIRAPSHHASTTTDASVKASFWVMPGSSGAGLQGRF